MKQQRDKFWWIVIVAYGAVGVWAVAVFAIAMDRCESRTAGLPPPATGAAEVLLLPHRRPTRGAASPPATPGKPVPAATARDARAVLKGGPARPSIAGLFAALRAHESLDGRKPVGDGGRSLGDYHIGRAHWSDGCETGRVSWPYDKYVWSRPHCEAVMIWYWLRWCPRALREGDWETLARVHNGGPRGAEKSCTLTYWRRIQERLR